MNGWTGIVGDCLAGPHILPHLFTGSHYRDFLFHNLPKLVEDIPLAVRARVCMMVLLHISAVLCQMFSATPTVTNE
jgi:hypothetical protein